VSVSNHFLSPGENIEDLKHANEHLQEANREITAILESITDGFVHLDTLWRFTYVNRPMATLTGREPEELRGQSLWDMLPEFRGSYLENRLYEAQTTQRTIHFEAQKPWYERWFEVHIYPASDGLSVYFHDMTVRKQAEEALRQSRDAFRLLIEAMLKTV
jgi:PAS domain S-box-containing protein